MDRQTLNAMKFSVSRWASHLTWPWMALVGLLVFSSGIFLSVITPAQRDRESLRQHLSTLQMQGLRTEKSIRSASPTQLAIFYNHFPAERSLPDWLEKIQGAAKRNALLLQQGDYHIARDKGGKLLRYQIKMPINGSYLNIRKFLGAVLTEIPTASLDNVKFERQKIGDSTIEATVELSLYFGLAS